MICPGCGHRLTAPRSIEQGMGQRCIQRERLAPYLLDDFDAGTWAKTIAVLVRGIDGNFSFFPGGSA